MAEWQTAVTTVHLKLRYLLITLSLELTQADYRQGFSTPFLEANDCKATLQYFITRYT